MDEQRTAIGAEEQKQPAFRDDTMAAPTDDELRTRLSQREEDLAPERPKAKNKALKRIGIVLFVLLNAAVIGYTASLEFTKEKPAPMQPFSFINILFLLGGVLCLAVVLASETVKYLLMMRHLGEKVSLKVAFETAALGKYYDCITPSGAGGQPFQIWHLHSNGYSSGASSAMPLSGFCTMQFGFVFLAIAVFIFGHSAIDLPGMRITAYVGAATYLIVPLMIVISGIAPKISMRIVAFFVKIGAGLRIVKNPNHKTMSALKALHNYSTNLKKITKHRGLFLRLMVLSVVFQTAISSIPYFVIHTFGGEIGFFKALSMTVFIQAVVCLIPTPGNSGAAEGSFYLVFNELAGAFWAMLVWRLLCYYSFIMIGVLIYGYNALMKLKNRKKEKLNHDPT